MCNFGIALNWCIGLHTLSTYQTNSPTPRKKMVHFLHTGYATDCFRDSEFRRWQFKMGWRRADKMREDACVTMSRCRLKIVRTNEQVNPREMSSSCQFQPSPGSLSLPMNPVVILSISPHYISAFVVKASAISTRWTKRSPTRCLMNGLQAEERSGGPFRLENNEL